jgi:hypothetical protein
MTRVRVPLERDHGGLGPRRPLKALARRRSSSSVLHLAFGSSTFANRPLFPTPRPFPLLCPFSLVNLYSTINASTRVLNSTPLYSHGTALTAMALTLTHYSLVFLFTYFYDISGPFFFPLFSLLRHVPHHGIGKRGPVSAWPLGCSLVCVILGHSHLFTIFWFSYMHIL